MLAETISTTVRAQPLPAEELSKWSVPGWAYPGLMVPGIQTLWQGWSGTQYLRSCFELYNGFVPAVAVLAILFRSRLAFLGPLRLGVCLASRRRVAQFPGLLR